MRSIGLALCLALPAVASAQPADSVGPSLFETTQGAFFALSVADRAASARWYSEKLGLEVAMEVPEGDGPGMTLLQGGGLTVELVEEKEAQPLAGLVPSGRGALFIHGIFKVGFVVVDYEATLEGLRGRGVEIALGPFPARADQPENFIIRDNAGNYLQIFGEYSTD